MLRTRQSEVFGPLDIAFNHAGVEEAIGTTADLKEEEWHRIIGINLSRCFTFQR